MPGDSIPLAFCKIASPVCVTSHVTKPNAAAAAAFTQPRAD